MHRLIACKILLLAMLFLSACGLGRAPISTVIVPTIIKETQIVEATRIVQETHIVQQTRIVIAEVTRIVRETIIVLPAPTTIPTAGATAAPVPAPTVAGAPFPPAEIPTALPSGIGPPLPRAQHTATLLLDGRVLIVGGSISPNVQLADVEIFDPATGISTRVAPLHTPRHGHTATLLLDGRVLVVAGYNHLQGSLSDSEVYDPSANVWTVVPMQASHGVEHTATLMKDGRVLVVGGAFSNQLTDQVDLFDPQTNSWYSAMPLESGRASHTAQLLEDGQVLVAGGGDASGLPAGGDASVYDPQTDSWTATGPMVYPRIFSKSVRLSDGSVLVVGGINLEDTLSGNPPYNALTSAEIYVPELNGWEATGDLSQARYGHVMFLLQDGRALVAGGARIGDCCWTNNSYSYEVEVYDPQTCLWDRVGELGQVGVYSAGVVLPDGRVLITGGETGLYGTSFMSDIWFYTP